MPRRPQAEADRPNYWCAADKTYGEIWEWLLDRHSSNFTHNFTHQDLERIHHKWKKLAAEA